MPARSPGPTHQRTLGRCLVFAVPPGQRVRTRSVGPLGCPTEKSKVCDPELSPRRPTELRMQTNLAGHAIAMACHFGKRHSVVRDNFSDFSAARAA